MRTPTPTETRSGFGGAEPRAALDALIERLDAQPLTVGDRTLDGDDVRVALGGGLHTKARWALLAKALVAAEHGDGRCCASSRTGSTAARPADATARGWTSSSPSAQPTNATRAPCSPTSTPARTRGMRSTTPPSSPATPSTPGARTGCVPETSSADGGYGGESTCIDAHVNAYLEHGILPAAGQRCRQQTPFEPPSDD